MGWFWEDIEVPYPWIVWPGLILVLWVFIAVVHLIVEDSRRGLPSRPRMNKQSMGSQAPGSKTQGGPQAGNKSQGRTSAAVKKMQ